MNQNSDHETDDFLEGIDDELQEERDEGLPIHTKAPSGSDSSKKLLILAGVVVFVLILFVVYLSAGKSGLSKKDLAPIEARIAQIDNRLKALETLADKIDHLEKQLKEAQRSLAEAKRVQDAAGRRVDTLTRDMKKLEQAETPASPPKSKARYHVVRRGDTLYSISKKYGTTIDDLRRINKLSKGQELQVGQKILLPSTAP